MRTTKCLFISLVFFLTVLNLFLSQARADSYLDVDVTVNFVPPASVPAGTTWSGSLVAYDVALPYVGLPNQTYTTVYSGSFSSIPTSQSFTFQFLIDTTLHPTATNQLVLSNFGGAVLPPQGAPPLNPTYYNNGWIASPVGYQGGGYPASQWALWLPTLTPGMDLSGALNTNPQVYAWPAGTFDVTVTETPEPASILLVGSLIGLIATRKIFKTQFGPLRIPS